MASKDKNKAEQFLQLEALYTKAILDGEKFVEKKKELLESPVYEEDDEIAELSGWNEILLRGGITKEEFAARKEMLLAKDKPSRVEAEAQRAAQAAQAAAPKPTKPKKKRKTGCGCFMVIAGAVGLMWVLGNLSSCSSNAATRTSANRYVAPKTTTQRVSESPTKQAALDDKEAWRADFEQKIAGFPEEDRLALNAGMSYFSSLREMLVAIQRNDNEGTKTFKDKFDRLGRELEARNPRVFKMVNTVGEQYVIQFRAAKKQGKFFDFPMEEIANKVVSAYQKDAAMRARIDAARSAGK